MRFLICFVAVLALGGQALAQEKLTDAGAALDTALQGSVTPEMKMRKEEPKPEKPPIPACPDSITVNKQTINTKNIPKGFKAFGEEVTYWVDSVQVHSGGKTTAKLEPYKNTEMSSQWRLVDNGKQDYWMVCGYRDTSVALKYKLPDSLKECRVLPRANPANPKGPQVLQLFSCE